MNVRLIEECWYFVLRVNLPPVVAHYAFETKEMVLVQMLGGDVAKNLKLLGLRPVSLQ